MKKIVHIMNGLDRGGTEKALFLLLKSLQTDYQFYIIVLDKPGIYSSQIANLGIPIKHLYMKTHPIKACLVLIKSLRQIRPDIVQTWLYHADLLGGITAKLCGVKKIIWGIRCEGIHLKKTTRIMKHGCALLSTIIPHHVVTNSQSAADKHIKAGYHAAKIRIIYNGFEIPAIKERVASKSESRTKITIGTLARYHPDKDYVTMIRAIDIICRAEPTTYFVLCGPGCHSKNEELIKLLAQTESAKQITLINGVPESTAYLNTLDIFVQSSKTESFSNSLVEAMLCGVPCVATDVGETRAICGEHAVLVAKENPEQLAQGCLKLIKKTPAERVHLGKLASPYIAHHFSLPSYALNFKTLYEST